MKIGFLILISITVCLCRDDKIRLEDVKVLTLYNDRLTNSRRTSPIPQLKCVGGSAGCTAFQPKVVQCENKGSDGYDVQWECKTDMGNRYRFGRIQVSCEGYDHPNDKYVLRGSCGLEYTLDLTKSGRNKKSSSGGPPYSSYGSTRKTHVPSGALGNMIFIVIVVIGIFFIYTTCIKSNTASDRYPDGTPTDPPPPYPGTSNPGYNAPPPPGFRPEYTHGYQEDCSTRYRATPTAPPSDNSSGAGFWTGAALGGLTGYLFGSSGSSNTYSNSYTYHEPRDRMYPDISRHQRDSSSDSDHGTRTASGFGGTTRR